MFEAAIQVKSTPLIKIMFENQNKKRKYGSKRIFFT